LSFEQAQLKLKVDELCQRSQLLKEGLPEEHVDCVLPIEHD